MMVLRARVDLAEGKFASAAHALETGLAFSRQIVEGPFLINGLVGIAIASQFLSVLEDWTGQPGAPNLYWSLTALPRPLLDLRNELEVEQRFIELQYPDLVDLERPRSAAQWDALLKRLRTDYQTLMSVGEKDKPPPIPPGTGPNDPAARSPDLDVAKKYLVEHMGVSADRVKAMPPAQVLLFYLVGINREVRDERFKLIHLPYPEARLALVEEEKRLKALPETEALRFAKMFLPALQKVTAAQNRVERRIAILRVIEALRLHAAVNGGRLPDKLTQVTAVPVPDDPGTGRPFEYQRDGQTATLTGRIPGEPLAFTGLRFRIEVRKK
jgi:hypothetical protein